MMRIRSASSIRSANGYRQWFLKHGRSPQVHQFSSFDIVYLSYVILLGTLDFLRRLTLKDCLHTRLQLNNSICEIIDLFINRHHRIMDFEYYSMLFYRFHSLIKQRLTMGYTYRSRIIYIHC